jgi:biopolymer transport protein ExbB/TolQ
MDNQILLYIMTVFVVIAGISLLLQLATLFGIYRTAKSTEQKVSALMPKVESLIASSQKIIDDSKQQILDIATKTNEILNSTKRQLAVVEEVLADASSRAKVQLERAELVIDDTMSRAHETVAMVHNGIARPLREIQGVAAGIRAAVAHLAKGGRPSVAQATHDEEMFI